MSDSTIAGTVSRRGLESVPVASWANPVVIKAGDPDPLEVVVSVPASKSRRGWNYKPEALKEIVEVVMKEGLAGHLGHQKSENLETEFPTPVTHWIGAKWDDAKQAALFRGVVDKSARDLKRWIRAGTVKQVSIFGRPVLSRQGGKTNVISYNPYSIDWVPLNRAGMSTSIVATGEQVDSSTGEERKYTRVVRYPL